MSVKDAETLGRELLAGKNGAALREAAASEEARALGQKLDPKLVEQAVRSGDGEKLREVLTQVLNTEEGRALAEKLSKLKL